MRRLPLLLLLAALAPAAAGAQGPRLTDAGVRAFVAAQERAWNAENLKAYFAGFTPDAVFVDQALSSENRIVPYGRSTLAQARRQAARAAAKSQLHEDGMVQAVRIAADGRSADVASQVTARSASGGTLRLSCLRRSQTVVLTPAGLRSRGQTDTVVRCRR